MDFFFKTIIKYFNLEMKPTYFRLPNPKNQNSEAKEKKLCVLYFGERFDQNLRMENAKILQFIHLPALNRIS